MSKEANPDPVDQPENSGGSQGNQNENSQNTETETNDKVSYESYKKALDEKKSVQRQKDEELNEMKQKLQKLEEEKLEKEGKTEELLETYKKKAQDLEEQYNKERQTYAWTTVKEKIKTEAVRQGCTQPDKLIKLLDDDDLKTIEVDSSYNVDNESLKGVIEKSKKENHFLFGSSTPLADGNPSTSEPNKTKKSEQELFEEYVNKIS